MPSRAATIALVSDHELFRQVVAQRLADQGVGPVLEVASKDELLALAKRRPLEIAIIDLDHGSEDVMELVRALRRELPMLHVITLATPTRALADAAMVLDSETLGRATVVTALVSGLRAGHDDRAVQWSRVTERQRDVMRWLALGLDNAAIGHKLRIGERAVKAHVSSLLDLFGFANRTQLALLADRAGLRPSRR